MMIGEFLIIIVYFIYRFFQSKESQRIEQNEAKKKGKDINFNKFLYAIPAVLDTCGTTFNFFGLVYVTASVYQMMRAFMIVITAILSRIFLGRRYYRHHFLGIGLIIFGLGIVGTASVIHTSNSGGIDTVQPVGFIFLFIAQCFAATMYVTEERLFQKCYSHPLQAVGLEGLSGCSILLILIPFLNLIPATTIYSKSGQIKFAPFGVVESLPYTLAQILNSAELFWLVIGSILSLGIFNWCGISVTFYLSSSSRAVVDPTRAITIWIFSILFGWEDFIIWELIGFLFYTTGMLTFNEIIRFPIFGLNEYTKEKLEARAKEQSANQTNKEENLLLNDKDPDAKAK